MNPNPARSVRAHPQAKARPLPPRAYTSREAAQVSEVPFFTVDYWARTKFLVPTVAKGNGRGKGRQRMYSYDDIVRLRIARELRDQKVSLETLRTIVDKLGGLSGALAKARFILVGRKIETATSFAALMAILRRPGQRTFGVLLDLRVLLRTVRERALALDRATGAPRRRGGTAVGARTPAPVKASA
ncbi:MAG TPA: helix-turn-helix domain-containing protein [Thermoanaerobaculia bacterium]